MSDDDAIDPTEPGMLELGKRLEAYADARLSPSVEGTTRLRRNVMNVAHRRAAFTAADAGGTTTAGATTAALAADRVDAVTSAWRRPAAAIFAGLLTLVVLVGTAFAAKPGGPLYGARLWTEMANLPADVVARAQAEVSRLDARLHEAQQASTAGDGPAAMAALSAYAVIVIEAGKGSGGDPTARAAIEVTVTRHVVVLTLMVDSVPPPARAAVEHALSSSTMVLDDLEGAGKQDSSDLPVDATVSKATKRTTPATPSKRERPVRPTRVVEPSGPHDDDSVKPALDATSVKDDLGGQVRHTDGRRPGAGDVDGTRRKAACPDGPLEDRIVDPAAHPVIPHGPVDAGRT